MKYFIVLLALHTFNIHCNKKSIMAVTKSNAVKSDSTIQEQRELLRDYALCSCIINGSGDSSNKNDYSRSLYADQSLYSERSLLYIDSISIVFAQSIKPAKYEAYKGQKAIIYFCTEFYKSQRLDSLIKSLDSTIYK
jgi:hypothetical protein